VARVSAAEARAVTACTGRSDGNLLMKVTRCKNLLPK